MSSLIGNMPRVLLGAALIACLMPALSLWGGVRSKKEDVGRFTKEDAGKLAIAVAKAAHPTAKNPAMLKFSQSELDNVIRLKLEIVYFGAASSNRYTADSLIQIQLPKKAADPLEVKSIDFVDNNNSIRPNTKNLENLRTELNARYRIEAAK